MQKRKLIALTAVAGMLAMILDSRIALSAAAEGVQLCISTVIPSLFPFLFLSGIFGRSCPGAGLPGQLLGKAYGIPPSMEFMLVPMLLGGYPVGAQCIYEAYRQGTVSKETAQRMLAWCSNCGPAFLFGMLAAFFPSGKLLWLLWGIVLFSVWAASFVFSAPCNARRMDRAASPFGIDAAIGAMLKICGWVILFRVLLGFLNRWFLGAAPAEVRVLCAGLLELSNGSCMLNLIADERIRFCICGVLLACIVISSGSLFAGMVFHTVFNSTLLIASYWARTVETDAEAAYTGALSLLPFLLGALLFGSILMFLMRRFRALRLRDGRKTFGVPPCPERPVRMSELVVQISGIIVASVWYVIDLFRISGFLQ